MNIKIIVFFTLLIFIFYYIYYYHIMSAKNIKQKPVYVNVISYKKIKNEEIFKLNITWNQLLKYMKKGECPIQFPTYDFMWKCKPENNLETKVVYKFIKTHFYKKDIPKNKIQNLISFKKHFDQANKSKDKSKDKCICFPNLRNNILMVVPLPVEDSDFSSIQPFLKNADPTTKSHLWKKIYKTFMKIKHGKNLVTLSTDGHGVSYLHIRLADYTKRKDYGYTKKTLSELFPI